MVTSSGQLGNHAWQGGGCRRRSGLRRNGPPYAPGVIGVMDAVTFVEGSRGACLNLRDKVMVTTDELWRHLERYPPGWGIAEDENRDCNQGYDAVFPSDMALSLVLLGTPDSINFGLYARRCREGCPGLYPSGFGVLRRRVTRRRARE